MFTQRITCVQIILVTIEKKLDYDLSLGDKECMKEKHCTSFPTGNQDPITIPSVQLLILSTDGEDDNWLLITRNYHTVYLYQVVLG